MYICYIKYLEKYESLCSLSETMSSSWETMNLMWGDSEGEVASSEVAERNDALGWLRGLGQGPNELALV